MPKYITIFGANGFVGRHLVRRLAKTGAIIRIPTRDPEKALRLKPMGDVGQIVPMACSMRNDQTIVNAIKDADLVINLIGILYESGRNTFQSIHVEMAARIARLAKENGVGRFGHMSALGAKIDSHAKYASTKAAGERAVRSFFSDATIFRPSIIFGPEDNFFNLFATLARYSPILPLFGNGITQFQPVYVGDVAEAIVTALDRASACGQVYELGGPQIYTFRGLLELMLYLIKRQRYLLNIPWTLANLQAIFFECLPHPLLTRDQVELLKSDNIISDARALTLGDLGITPTALEVILPTYLHRFEATG
jgi:uncharacterized protein YbjT (DUF2867 family)